MGVSVGKIHQTWIVLVYCIGYIPLLSPFTNLNKNIIWPFGTDSCNESLVGRGRFRLQNKSQLTTTKSTQNSWLEALRLSRVQQVSLILYKVGPYDRYKSSYPYKWSKINGELGLFHPMVYSTHSKTQRATPVGLNAKLWIWASPGWLGFPIDGDYENCNDRIQACW